MLRLADRWLWDWWLADTGSAYHLFFLQAPRALGTPSLRHRNASIGRAVSTDLRSWRVLPDALGPGPAGTWDDIATWTGSTVRHGDTWYLFYSGTSTREQGKIQRIGLATSRDLMDWTRHPGPIIEADRRWYEVEDTASWRETSWRDPWVLPDPDGDGFHALITARSAVGPADGRGVVGHARSADLHTWEVRPPLSRPGDFGHLEVPQVEMVDGTALLVFSCASADFSAARRARRPDEPTGSFVAVGESLLGPWDIAGARRLDVPDLYSARIVRDRGGAWQVLGFVDGSERGEFAGVLSDPVPLQALGLP